MDDWLRLKPMFQFVSARIDDAQIQLARAHAIAARSSWPASRRV